MVLYIHPSPIRKSIQKSNFFFDRFYKNADLIAWSDCSTSLKESPPISFLPNSPPQAQRSGPPHFLPFVTHERVMSTQQIPSNWGMQNPLHTKMGEKSNSTTFLILNKKEASNFWFPPQLCTNNTISSIGKEVDLHWSPSLPHDTERKRISRSFRKGAI